MLYFKILLFLLFNINLYANSLVVVVSKHSNINNISKKQLSKIFLAKTKRISNNEEVVAIELANKDYQKKFYKLVCNKNEKQLKKYWAKMIFTGRGQPPKKINSIKELISFMQKNKNAISYLPLESLTDDIKVIKRIN